MLLLAVIALAQLAVLVMILAVVTGHASHRESETALAGERIRSIQRQTIEAMFAAADGDIMHGNGRGSYPGP